MTDTSRHLKEIIGSALLLGFIIAFFPNLTGLDGHQILGTALGSLAAYHGWAHRAWIGSVARRLATGPFGRGKLIWLLDAALAVSFAAIVGTGLLISTWLALPVATLSLWTNLHVLGSVATLGLVLVKVATHWRWFIRALRPKVTVVAAKPVSARAAIPVRTGPTRREFLGLMGALGVAAVAAGASALGGRYSFGTAVAQSGSTTTDSTAAGTANAVSTAEATATTSSTCTVLCNRGCSFPGQCRRYVDANANGRCDRGECL